MALTQQQINELNIAAKRGTATDLANIAYAQKTYGYQPPTQSSTPAPRTLNIAPPTGLTGQDALPINQRTINMATPDQLKAMEAANDPNGVNKEKWANYQPYINPVAPLGFGDESQIKAKMTPDEYLKRKLMQAKLGGTTGTTGTPTGTSMIDERNKLMTDPLFGGNPNQGDTFNDLLQQRQSGIFQKYHATNDVTPEELQMLSPAQQAALRGDKAGGIEGQLKAVESGLGYLSEQRKAEAERVAEANKPVKRETSLSEVGGRRVLIDTQSGEILSDYGDISSPLDIAKYNLDVAKYENDVLNTGAGKPLSAEASKLIANAQSALGDIDILSSFNDARFGSGRAFNPQYKAAENNVVDVIGRLRSGGAITEDEQKSFMSLMPSLLESDATRATKLSRLKTLLGQAIEGIQPTQNATQGTANTFSEPQNAQQLFSNDLNTSVKGSISTQVIRNSPISSKTGRDIECVIYSRLLAPGLPTMPYKDGDKKYNAYMKRRVINPKIPINNPPVNAVAIMPTIGNYGHVANVVSKNQDGTITIQEANYIDGKITRRTGTPQQLGIEGYWSNNIA